MLYEFDPQIHICKFGFEYYGHALISQYQYNIVANLYQREISISFYNKRNKEIVDTLGFHLSTGRFNELLHLVRWEDYEKYRDLPWDWFWDFKNGHNGYRDGWGYHFWCLNESGNPLIQIDMSTLFYEKKLPQYEKLLKWIIGSYGDKIKKHIQNKEWCVMW